jgi:hypothetical protein
MLKVSAMVFDEEAEMLDEMRIGTLVRPERLVEGAWYVWVEKTGKCNCASPDVREVQFVGFTSCPGVVLVCENAGQRLRCLRERLFTPG